MKGTMLARVSLVCPRLRYNQWHWKQARKGFEVFAVCCAPPNPQHSCTHSHVHLSLPNTYIILQKEHRIVFRCRNEAFIHLQTYVWQWCVGLLYYWNSRVYSMFSPVTYQAVVASTVPWVVPYFFPQFQPTGRAPKQHAWVPFKALCHSRTRKMKFFLHRIGHARLQNSSERDEIVPDPHLCQDEFSRRS